MSGTKRKRPARSPWDAAQGWKRVDIGDELLIGSEEGGFLELEELRPTPGLLSGAHATAPPPAEPADGEALEPTRKVATGSKKAKAGGKGAAPEPHATPSTSGRHGLQPRSAQAPAGANAAGEGGVTAQHGSDDVAALRAQLARLGAENKRLKRLVPADAAAAMAGKVSTSGQEGGRAGKVMEEMEAAGGGVRPQETEAGGGDGEAAEKPASRRSEKIAAKRAKAREVRQARKEAARARKARAAAALQGAGVWLRLGGSAPP